MPGTIVDLRHLPEQERALVRAHGPDTLRFLQGLLSADLERCPDDAAIPATLLTVKGKILADVIVWRDGADAFVLAVPSRECEAFVAKLDRHLIMDEVELERLDPARSRCATAWGERPVAPDTGGVRVLQTVVPTRGWLVVGPEDALATMCPANDDAVALWFGRRVTDGTPAWGHEVQADRFPPEVGHVAAVSYDKGCFLGQEPLSRIHSRGRVNRVLTRVRLDAGDWPGHDDVLRSDGREDCGRVTSRSTAEGLAVLHRSAAVPDTVLSSGNARLTVVSGPIGDDEGVSTTKAATVKLGRR